MDRESQGARRFIPLCYILPLWLMSYAALSAWNQGVAGRVMDLGWETAALVLGSFFYSLCFLARWERVSFTCINGCIAVSAVLTWFFLPGFRRQMRYTLYYLHGMAERTYGISFLPDRPEMESESMEAVIAWLFFLVLWLTLYLFWREVPVLVQILPMTCFYILPVILDGRVSQGTMVCFFGGGILWWMIGRKKSPERWMALVCGVPVFILSVCLVGVLFSEERYQSLLSRGSGEGTAGAGEVLQEARDTLFGRFAPEGYIHYDDITMYRLTVQSHLNREAPLYLKNFEADTYRDGIWRGEEQTGLSVLADEFVLLKSGGIRVKKTATHEDVIVYGENMTYRTDESGRIFVSDEKNRRYQSQEKSWEEYLARPLIPEEIGEQDLPGPVRKQCRKLLGDRKRATYRELVRDILNSYEKNFSYTLSPGKAPEGKDEITYFLRKSHRGYCTHFASAAVFLFRSQGVSARYVQGYCVEPEFLRERFPMEVKDYMAHAWVEIWIDDCFVPVDVTPAAFHNVFYGETGERGGSLGQAPAAALKPDMAATHEPATQEPEGEKIPEEDGSSGGSPAPAWLFPALSVLLALILLTALVMLVSRHIRRQKLYRSYRRCLRGGEWVCAIWLLQEAFLDFMEDTGFVWEETDREWTREHLGYALSMYVHAEDEKELREFYRELDRYVNTIYELRYKLSLIPEESMTYAPSGATDKLSLIPEESMTYAPSGATDKLSLIPEESMTYAPSGATNAPSGTTDYERWRRMVELFRKILHGREHMNFIQRINLHRYVLVRMIKYNPPVSD